LLNLHFAGVALLLILNLVSGGAALSGLEHFARRRYRPAACSSRLPYRALQLEMSPLQGIAAEGRPFPHPGG
jgi:hypothetical protein